MLENFIETNNLKARIVNRRQSSNLIKCKLFLTESAQIIVISLATDKSDLEKIKRVLGAKEIFAADEKQAIEITGYEKNFLPPISIYGVKVLLDKGLSKHELLYCNISEASCLEISLKEIQENNEDVIVGEYCR